jgi:hypothetical protein
MRTHRVHTAFTGKNPTAIENAGRVFGSVDVTCKRRNQRENNFLWREFKQRGTLNPPELRVFKPPRGGTWGMGEYGGGGGVGYGGKVGGAFGYMVWFAPGYTNSMGSTHTTPHTHTHTHTHTLSLSLTSDVPNYALHALSLSPSHTMQRG